MEQLRYLTREILDIHLSRSQIDLFHTYKTMLFDWNQRISLTAITQDEEIIIKHFFDSLTCLTVINVKRPISIADIGTGAGFPGIPIKIALPHIQLTLIESVVKKSEFCSLAVENLHLKNVKVLTRRVEEIGQDLQFREQFDYVVARAVSGLSTLAEYALPLIKIGGDFIAMKADHIEQELQSGEKAIEMLGGEIHSVRLIELPKNMGNRSLIVVNKNQKSPPEYPRRVGIPKKRPIE